MRAWVLVALAALCACATPKEEAPAKQPTSRLESPVRVTWHEVSRTATRAEVLARVERVLAMDMPFSVQVALPPGVRAEGRLAYTLPPNAEAGTAEERLVLEFDAVPEGDAVLKVDGDTGTVGFHFQVPYRFGRPAPVTPAPAATGPELKKGDTTFGPSVPLR